MSTEEFKFFLTFIGTMVAFCGDEDRAHLDAGLAGRPRCLRR